jgi:hypothetical protein
MPESRRTEWSRPSPRRFIAEPKGSVERLSRADLARCVHWSNAFATCRKDRRFYELVEDTICPAFEYRYFALRDEAGQVRAIQPFFLLDQDVLLGMGARVKSVIASIRRIWPRFMVVRTIMIGCAAGEGRLDDAGKPSRQQIIELLAQTIRAHAREQRAGLIVLKEFPAQYRGALACFLAQGFTRVPSLPMTRLNIDYASFEDYMARALKSATRAKLRKKFRATEQSLPITMEVAVDVSALAGQLYPLYLQVYNRSALHFEKLSEAFFCAIGREMPDKVRFFIWRQNGKIVAFTLCMIESNALYAEYIGLGYSVALDLHLYHYAVRDMINWAILNELKWFRSSGLNYAPKLQMRHALDPVDLYVRHTSTAFNLILKRLLPLLEPTRSDEILKKFPNYRELWSS